MFHKIKSSKRQTRSDTISSIASIESDDASLIEDIRRIRVEDEPDNAVDVPEVSASAINEELVQQLADASRNADSDSDSRERAAGNRKEVCVEGTSLSS